MPDSFDAWFEAGLHSKARGLWRESAVRNQRALELFGPAEAERFEGASPAAWNLGIAATAIGDWATARRAWTDFGIEGFDPSDEPIDADLGMVPIRINPDRASLTHQVMFDAGDTEVVWCWRRSPAHAVVASVPLPESGHRFRDVLLHDGEPKGSRRNGDREVPVFDELDRLEESGLSTWQAILDGVREGDLDRLADVLGPLGLGLDTWSGMRILCSECSHGSPDDGHEHAELAPGRTRLGLAGDEAALRAALDTWLRDHKHVGVEELVLLW